MKLRKWAEFSTTARQSSCKSWGITKRGRNKILELQLMKSNILVACVMLSICGGSQLFSDQEQRELEELQSLAVIHNNLANLAGPSVLQSFSSYGRVCVSESEFEKESGLE